MIQYTLGRAYNPDKVGGTTTGESRTSGLNTFPANKYELSGEWLRADFDQRHRFILLATINPGRYFRISVAFTAYTGELYNETTGRGDNSDGLANDRPTGVRRNEGPSYADLDLRRSPDFFFVRVKKDKVPQLLLDFDVFNVIRHADYVTHVGVLSSPFFGKPISARQEDFTSLFASGSTNVALA